MKLKVKRLKDSGTSITESLTAYKMGQLNKAQDEKGNSTKLFYC